MPVSDAIADLYSRDLIISKLRWYIAGLEKRLAGASASSDRDQTAEPGTPESLLFSLDQQGAVAHSSEVAAIHRLQPGILDLGDDGGHAFEAVARVEGGFWVHPRPGKLSVACLGPFDGPPPVLVTAKVQVENAQGPRVAFAVDRVRTQLDEDVLLETARKQIQRGFEWVQVSPLESRTVLSLETGSAGQWGKWAIVLATKSLEDPKVEFGWATFKDVTFYHLAGDRLERSTVA